MKTWGQVERARKVEVSKSPRIDQFAEGKILMPGQFAYELMQLAKLIESELTDIQQRTKNLEIIAKSARHDKNMMAAKKYPKKENEFINPYESLSSDEVMEKLRGFGFGRAMTN